MSLLHISDIPVGGDSPLLLIAGPCQVEGRDHALMCAERLSAMARDAGMGFVYKSSYDKANRTSANAARGVGMEEGLRIFEAVKDAFGCPVLSDVHLPEQCAPAAEVIDVLQIPAFLCRQTDLLLAAAATGAAINVKKGQFLAPWDMKHVAAKITGAGNDRVLLTERGTSFGYNTLVSDMRALPQMAGLGHPVIFDATHSVQQPGGLGGIAGQRPHPQSPRQHGAHQVDAQQAGGPGHEDRRVGKRAGQGFGRRVVHGRLLPAHGPLWIPFSIFIPLGSKNYTE